MFGDLFHEDGADPGGGSGDRVVHKKMPLPPRLASGLCGIYNQGATCYLNSLIQTLLMTPEFRESLLQLLPSELGRLQDKEKPGAKVRVIPLQLQKLFGALLLLNSQGAYTTELTDSFGWTNNEELQQHDVQELNRILFCAIEDSLIGTSGQSLIQDLYHGLIVNQITCQQCGNTSEREEDFLDLSLAVAGHLGVKDALSDYYVEEEYLEGKNKYRCEICQKLVNAKKGAKLRRLPPILTLSLLRFSFDFKKLERYKETGKFEFPPRLDMSSYCENLSSAGNTEYELFSVVIHSGSTHGGHYHAYIRDIDGLGTWSHPEETELQIPTDPLTGQVDFIQFDSPLEMIQAILWKAGKDGMPLDQLCTEIATQTGVSWNKRFKRKYGPIVKFFKKYDDKFDHDSLTNIVKLKDYRQCDKTADRVKSNTSQEAEKSTETEHKSKNRPPLVTPGPGQCWFDYNDARVLPITTDEIQRQFSGKESAYMLFYRQRGLTRTPEAYGDPSYGIPVWLLEEMVQSNVQLQQDRDKYEAKINSLRLKVYFSATYTYKDGALHLKDGGLPFIEITIDRRKSIESLIATIQEIGGDILHDNQGDQSLVMHMARDLPAGIHLYYSISEDREASIMSTDLGDNSKVFVWDGKQVDGHSVPVGECCEPVEITVTYGNPSQCKLVMPMNATLDQLRCEICERIRKCPQTTHLSRMMTKGGENKLMPVSHDDDTSTLAELKFQNGEHFVAENTTDKGGTIAKTTLTRELNMRSFIVENRCQDCDHGVWPIASVEVDKSANVEELKAVIISCVEIPGSIYTCRLRSDDDNLGLQPPLHEHQSIDSAGLKQGQRIILEEGYPPSSNQITLSFEVSRENSDDKRLEVIVDRSSTIQNCLMMMITAANLQNTDWHLRRTNWCGEAAKILDDLDDTIEHQLIKDGEHLLLEKGKLPPKGYLKLPVWFFPTLPRLGQEVKNMQKLWMSDTLQAMLSSLSLEANSGVEPVNPVNHNDSTTKKNNTSLYVGDVEVSKQATLEDLKLQIMTLPLMEDVQVPMFDFLRVRKLENHCPETVLRNSSLTLQKLKLTNGCELGVQVLQEEEDLKNIHLVLQIQKRIPRSRKYEPPEELVWTHGQARAKARSLREEISLLTSIPADKIKMAKHFPEKFQWMVIKNEPPDQKSGNKSKGNKGKSPKSSVRQAPYFLSDGDVIGIKDLTVNNEADDFGTVKDDLGLEKEKEIAEEKRKRREEQKKMASMALEGGGDGKRRQEASIKIHVEDFR